MRGSAAERHLPQPHCTRLYKSVNIKSHLHSTYINEFINRCETWPHVSAEIGRHQVNSRNFVIAYTLNLRPSSARSTLGPFFFLNKNITFIFSSKLFSSCQCEFRQLVCHKSHIYWIGIEPGTPRWEAGDWSPEPRLGPNIAIQFF